MLKRSVGSLLFAIGMLITPLTNATEFSSQTFEERYPNLNDFIAWNASAGIATTIYENAIALDSLEQKNEPEIFGEIIITKKQQIECLKKINPHQIFDLKQKSVAYNLSNQELQVLEQHYTSTVGKSETAYGKSVTNAMNSSNIKMVKVLMNQAKNPTVQAMIKQRKLFEKTHQATFTKFFNLLETPKIKSMESKSIEACFPAD